MNVIEAMKGVPDHRGRQGREYPLYGLLGLMMVAILSGRKGLRGIARYGQDYPEILPYLGFSPDKPYLLAHTTLSRMLEGVNLKALRGVLHQELKFQEGQTLVLDGKKLRGSRGMRLRYTFSKPLLPKPSKWWEVYRSKAMKPAKLTNSLKFWGSTP